MYLDSLETERMIVFDDLCQRRGMKFHGKVHLHDVRVIENILDSTYGYSYLIILGCSNVLSVAIYLMAN